jgi:hypothetical protein
MFSPILRFALASLLCWTALVPASAARQGSGTVDAVLNDVERAFKQSSFQKAHPEYKIRRDNYTVMISYHPKQWLVYGSSMTGEWSKTPHNETGPDSDGLIITIAAVDLKDAVPEQFAGRANGFDLQEFDGRNGPVGNAHVIRHPYWSVYCCGQEFAKRGVKVTCNIEFNNRTDRKLLREAFAPIAKSLAGPNKS